MKRGLAILSRLAGGAAVLVLLGWAVSRALSDRFIWSQWPLWVPSAAYALVVVVLWLASWGASRTARCPGSPRRAGGRTRAAAALGAAPLLAYIAFVELRLGNALWGPRASDTRLRVVNWNLTQLDSADAVAAGVGPLAPDIAVFVNNPAHPQWRRLLTELGLNHAASQQAIHIASRLPILRSGSCTLGLPLPPLDPGGSPSRIRYDPGRAMYAEIDTTAALGRPIILWVIDMPSDERLSRWQLARQAQGAIASWTGTEARGEPPTATTAQAGPGFPPPDLIIGDFNIPRGSASLGHLTRGLRNAFDEAGWGYCATWPRRRPLVHIDQAFVAPTVRAVHYETRDPGYGYHRLQVVDLAPAH